MGEDGIISGSLPLFRYRVREGLSWGGKGHEGGA